MTAEAYVEIVEQPASKAFRFRYESERRSHGSIPGVNSTPTRKTFPTIRIIGPYRNGRVIVSCVTKDEYRAHPHRIVSKEPGAYHGVFVASLDPDSNEIEFKNLGIQCVKRKDIKKSLEERRNAGVDPFRMGYDHTDYSVNDMNTVRLCFQVYLLKPLGNCSEQTEIELEPVVSNPIHARQSFSDLVICQLSSAVASVAGGTVLMIFCQKIMKDDIKVRFFEERNGRVVWETFGKFQPKDVFDQSAIVLLTPPYYTQHVDHPIDIFVQLIRPSTNDVGKPVSLQLLPSSSMYNKVTDAEIQLSLKRKRKNFESVDSLEHPNKASCGCILAPIINPDCPIHSPQSRTLNQGHNLFLDNKPGYESTWNVPQKRSKLFYYNQNISTEGAMSLPKKPKYSESFVPPAYHTVHSTASNLPQIPQKAFNSPTQCQYQYRPAVVPNYQPLPSPQRPQCMYQSPLPRNTTPIVPDVPAVPFDNQKDWQVQLEPTLQPIIVKLSEQQTPPPRNYDYNPRGQIDMNQNLLDFDLDDSVNQLSDSLTNGLNLDDQGLEDLEEFNKYEISHDDGFAMGLQEVCEDNNYAVQGILNVSQNQKPQNQQNYLTNAWLCNQQQQPKKW